MLGNSSNKFDPCLSVLVKSVKPQTILELGCGEGKFGSIMQQTGLRPHLRAVQKIFSSDEPQRLRQKGYEEIIDRDILDYYKEGFDENYSLIVGLDVAEHFLYSDVISIINFSLYRADFMLLVWPSAHPQMSVTNPFDRHRASFELKDLADKFDIVFYSQTGFAQMHYRHRYHIALLRGFMNHHVLPPIL
ncbi:hypothetical protein LBMAG30_27570 [Comamonadaceae bacterium]|nr:hypothetical protein LBMAG30_27570 [Comamonadaceae bacterium]